MMSLLPAPIAFCVGNFPSALRIDGRCVLSICAGVNALTQSDDSRGEGTQAGWEAGLR